MSSDCIIVGGGIIGLTCAYELLRIGMHVKVYDRAPLSASTSYAAGGMLAPICEAEISPAALTTLAQDSRARYPDYVAALEALTGSSVGLRLDGTLFTAFNSDDAASLDHLAQTLQSKGIATQHLDVEQALDYEPALSPRLLSALHIPQDAQIDPRRLLHTLEQAITTLGGSIVRDISITRYEKTGSDITLHTHAGTRLKAHHVIFACGAWSQELLPQLDVRPVKGQLVRLQGRPLLRHIVRTPDVYLIPRANGELLIGATSEEQGFDQAATAGAVYDLLRYAFRALPGIYELQFQSVSVGLRPATTHQLPIIDEIMPGCYVVTGHFRDGILLAAATGHYVAEWLRTTHRPAALQPFALTKELDHG